MVIPRDAAQLTRGITTARDEGGKYSVSKMHVTKCHGCVRRLPLFQDISCDLLAAYARLYLGSGHYVSKLLMQIR